MGNAVNAREIRKNVKKRFKALWGGHEPKTGSFLAKKQPFWVHDRSICIFYSNFLEAFKRDDPERERNGKGNNLERELLPIIRINPESYFHQPFLTEDLKNPILSG